MFSTLSLHVRRAEPTVSLPIEHLTSAHNPTGNETRGANPDDPKIAQPISSNEEKLDLQDTTIRKEHATLTGASKPIRTTISSYFHTTLCNKKIQEIDFLLVEAIVKSYFPFQIVEDIVSEDSHIN
jgi:hypothetical protein